MARATTSKWRSRSLAARLEGLADEPRPGAPRTITDEQVQRVITKTLEDQGLLESGRPPSERKLASTFGKASSRWARNRIAQALNT